MSKVYEIGQKIDLKLGVHHDVLVATLQLPNPPLKPGDKGDRVKALQEALLRLKFLDSHGVTGTYDAPTTKALGKFQHHWEIKEVHEQYDAATRAALQKALAGEQPPGNAHKPPPHKEPPPHKPPPSHDGTIRGKIVSNAKWGCANEHAIHYRQSRPIDGLSHPHKLPLYTDCSGFATDCYKWAGAPDPNGNGYDGQGYTGTMLNHMQHIQPAQVQPGDLVVYGAFPGDHVCVVLEPGHDPLLASHGQESGPIEIRHSLEHAAHGNGPVTWLTVFHEKK